MMMFYLQEEVEEAVVKQKEAKAAVDIQRYVTMATTQRERKCHSFNLGKKKKILILHLLTQT